MSGTITADQILDVLKEKSDFTFELSIVNKLSVLGHSCSHSGTYVDSVSGKIRQYDIRTEKRVTQLLLGNLTIEVSLYLAVECKCFRKEKPLVVHCTKRRHEESILDLIYLPNEKCSMPPAISGRVASQGRVLRLEGRRSELFYPDEFVGRSINQLHTTKPGNFDLTDGEVFEKLTQSISSVDDIIKDIHAYKREPNDQIFAALPILVIPDDLLWQLDYDKNGEIIGKPKQVEYVSLYIGRDSSPPFYEGFRKFQISHMFIATTSGIEKLVKESLSKTTFSHIPPFLGSDLSLAEALKNSMG